MFVILFRVGRVDESRDSRGGALSARDETGRQTRSFRLGVACWWVGRSAKHFFVFALVRKGPVIGARYTDLTEKTQERRGTSHPGNHFFFPLLGWRTRAGRNASDEKLQKWEWDVFGADDGRNSDRSSPDPIRRARRTASLCFAFGETLINSTCLRSWLVDWHQPIIPRELLGETDDGSRTRSELKGTIRI